MGWARFAGRTILAGSRMGGRAGQNIGGRLQQGAMGRAGRSGVLFPGDPTPPGNVSGYYDYRGIATFNEVRQLENEPFALGTAIAKRRGPRLSIGLSEAVLARHAAVIGPAGSGKTANVIVPWIEVALRLGWSVVTVDVKGDLLDSIRQASAPRGPIGIKPLSWDYNNPAGSVSFNWIDALDDEEAVDAAVQAILGKEPKQSTADPYHYRRDYSVLRGLLRVASARPGRGRTARDLLGLLNDQPRMEQVIAKGSGEPWADDLSEIDGMHPTDYRRAISGVATALRALNVAKVEAVTTKDELDLDRALGQPGLLVIGAPLAGGRLSETICSLMLNLVAQRLDRRLRHGGGPVQVMLMIDEAARILDRFDFEKVTATARSAGVSVCLALQDIAQIKDENDRSAILSNCATLMCLPGTSPLTQDYMGKRLGERPESFHSASRTPGVGYGRTSVSSSVGMVPVLGGREISSPPLYHYGSVTHVSAPEIGITPRPIISAFDPR